MLRMKLNIPPNIVIIPQNKQKLTVTCDRRVILEAKKLRIDLQALVRQVVLDAIETVRKERNLPPVDLL